MCALDFYRIKQPPVVLDDGSTVKTAIRAPNLVVAYFPKDSINELLPAPGGPVKPILKHIFELFSRFSFKRFKT